MYETLSSFAQTWGLLFFVVMFAAVLVYALLPRNQGHFDRAARTPLDESDSPVFDSANEDGRHV
jgi:cytochrome c oxidase cbb3-type subunit 4